MNLEQLREECHRVLDFMDFVSFEELEAVELEDGPQIRFTVTASFCKTRYNINAKAVIDNVPGNTENEVVVLSDATADLPFTAEHIYASLWMTELETRMNIEKEAKYLKWKVAKGHGEIGSRG